MHDNDPIDADPPEKRPTPHEIAAARREREREIERRRRTWRRGPNCRVPSWRPRQLGAPF